MLCVCVVCGQAHEEIERIQRMADVMWSAVTADSQPTDVSQYIAQLRLENSSLRELLTAGRHSLMSPVCSQAVQTDPVLADTDDDDDDDDDETSASASTSQCDTAGIAVSLTAAEVSSQHEPTSPPQPLQTTAIPTTDGPPTNSSLSVPSTATPGPTTSSTTSSSPTDSESVSDGSDVATTDVTQQDT